MLESCKECRWMIYEIIDLPYVEDFSREFCMWTNIQKDNIDIKNCPCQGQLPPSWRKQS